MTHVVETSVTATDNSPSQDYTQPGDHTTLSQLGQFGNREIDYNHSFLTVFLAIVRPSWIESYGYPFPFNQLVFYLTD